MFGVYQILIYFILKALIITIFIEILALLLQKEKNYKVYLLSIFINILTNISLNVGIQFINPNNYYLIVGILELIIVIIEASVYNLLYKDYKKSLRVAFLCNVSSYLLGFIFV